MTTERRYISAADTAKLIRKALKESFPGVKFSVRTSTYSGGASIRVCWTDGPTRKQVAAVAGVFSGSYFDGMIDYQGALYHTLDGQPVRFCADFVFCEREHSDAAITSAIIAAAMEYGTLDLPTVEEFRSGDSFRVSPATGRVTQPISWQAIIHRALEEWTPPSFEGCESPTLDRVTYAGSDGYGAAPGDRAGRLTCDYCRHEVAHSDALVGIICDECGVGHLAAKA